MVERKGKALVYNIDVLFDREIIGNSSYNVSTMRENLFHFFSDSSFDKFTLSSVYL